MSNNNSGVNGRVGPFIERFGVSIGTLVLIVAQTVAIVGWLVNDHAQINHLIENDGRILQRIDTLDTSGTRLDASFISRITQVDAELLTINRQFDLLSKRIDDVRNIEQSAEFSETHTEDRLQAQLDLLKQENSRIEEQQNRLIQALDNTYNLLQEHLRTYQGNKERGPPNLDLRQKQ